MPSIRELETMDGTEASRFDKLVGCSRGTFIQSRKGERIPCSEDRRGVKLYDPDGVACGQHEGRASGEAHRPRVHERQVAGV